MRSAQRIVRHQEAQSETFLRGPRLDPRIKSGFFSHKAKSLGTVVSDASLSSDLQKVDENCCELEHWG